MFPLRQRAVAAAAVIIQCHQAVVQAAVVVLTLLVALRLRGPLGKATKGGRAVIIQAATTAAAVAELAELVKWRMAFIAAVATAVQVVLVQRQA